MPRKGPAPRRELLADPIYHSVVVTQLTNKVMLHGKRSIAEKIVYDAMKLIAAKTGEDPLDTVKRAVDNVKPPLEVRSRRVGGATYQVPVEVRPRRSTTLAIRWLVDYSRARPREVDGTVPGQRTDGCRQWTRRGDEEARRHAEDGRLEQGVRSLPLVS